MKSLLVLFCLWATPSLAATAKTFKLDDPAILGHYTLAKADKKSEIQTADLVVNADSDTVLLTERNDGYVLSAPDKDGVIFNGTDEANCDGDESSCSYDASTVVKLLSTKNAKGEVIPQLSIEITVSYAWSDGCGGTDENGSDQKACDDELYTYVLNWDKALPENISFYKNIKIPALEKVEASCKKNLEKIAFDSNGPSYLGSYNVCGMINSFSYRDTFENAFPYLLKDWLGGNEKQPVEIKAKAVSAFFDQARALGKTYKMKGDVTSKDIVAELDTLEAYVLQADRFFSVPPMSNDSDDAQLFVVDTQKQTITRITFKIK